MYGTSEAGPVGSAAGAAPASTSVTTWSSSSRSTWPAVRSPPGVRSDKVYVTGLFNTTLPLIRFELTDQVTLLDRPCPCGSAHRLIADVQSRLDDVFTYPGGQVVHPIVFASVLGRDRGTVEYQVRQTPAGAQVLVVGTPADPAGLGRRLATELGRLGLPDPAVEVRPVATLDRQATGKVRRFRPLEAAVVSRPA